MTTACECMFQGYDAVQQTVEYHLQKTCHLLHDTVLPVTATSTNVPCLGISLLMQTTFRWLDLTVSLSSAITLQACCWLSVLLFFSTAKTIYLLLSREHFPRLLPFSLDASITSWCLYILHIIICLTMIQASFMNHRCPQILPFVYLGFNSQSVISGPSLVFYSDASSRRPPSYPWLSFIACSVALCFLLICVCGASFEFLIVQCSCL